jgi:hypothetical protein
MYVYTHSYTEKPLFSRGGVSTMTGKMRHLLLTFLARVVSLPCMHGLDNGQGNEVWLTFAGDTI